ncbi:MAG: translation elongation factor Ts [Bacteroidia bacterium]|jgi:elongation factor Ts|nr:translation elongation factor Ts [Bacteroidia bacterium]GIV24187.1 MAG: elongation factor Ts [Bacteroidia bacterium]
MSTITADQVKKLREVTGAGIMDCKKALEEAQGDFEKAIEILRKKGHKMAAARQERDANEGAVFAAVEEGEGHLILLACETDFVAKNEDFRAFGQKVAEAALKNHISSAEEISSLVIEGLPLPEKLAELTARIGEKMEVAKWASVKGEYVTHYIHMGGRIGVLVALKGTAGLAPEKLEEVGKNVAMQIAALRPVSVSRETVPADILEKEKEIARAQAMAEGKPPAIAEKIAVGKLEKFFKEAVLVEQEFFLDPQKTVGQYIRSVSPSLEVSSFVRLQVGGK